VKSVGKYSLYKYIHIEIRNNSYVPWDTDYILFSFPYAKYVRLKMVEKEWIGRTFDLSSDIQKVAAFYSVHRLTPW